MRSRRLINRENENKEATELIHFLRRGARARVKYESLPCKTLQTQTIEAKQSIVFFSWLRSLKVYRV